MLDHPCFIENYRLIAIELSKQYALIADQKVTQQINFVGNLKYVGNTTMSLVLEEFKETILGFSKRTVKVL